MHIVQIHDKNGSEETQWKNRYDIFSNVNFHINHIDIGFGFNIVKISIAEPIEKEKTVMTNVIGE